jgi:hypothetical protein
VDEKRKDFFWPSYVDLLTALFAVVLVLFVLSFYRLKAEIAIKEKEAALLNKVKKNLALFESDTSIFKTDTIYNRIELAFQVKFFTGYQYFKISSNDIDGDFLTTKKKLDALGKKLKEIVDDFRRQKRTDPSMKDISYLMVISGSASRLKGDDEYQSSILSYNRALYLYKYWKESLGIDFDSPEYHEIIELQISGVGFGGIDRYNNPYRQNNIVEEKKNQRFIISVAPKIRK